MKRGTSICLVAVLLGALMALSVAARGAQEQHTGPLDQSEDLQQKAERRVSLSDEDHADVSMARKSYDDAIEYYSRAIKSHPVSPQNRDQVAGLWNKMGICYQQKLDFRQARKAYNKAIRVKRDFAQAWNNLGTTFYLAHKAKKSIKFYRRAIKLSPMSASFHMNLGTAYFERKKYKQATEEYRTAIQLDPEILTRTSRQGTAVETRYVDARFYFYMAKIFASVGNTSEAVRYLQRAMEEGFKDMKQILKDPDLQKISNDPGFVALMKNPPVGIKD
jgi:tetratricopeptide (TPR) repeat protein